MKSIEQLKKENSKMIREINDLKIQIKKLKADNKDLSQMSRAIYNDEDVSRYRQMALKHSAENRELKERVQKLEKDCKEKQSTINQLIMMCKVKTK